MSEDPVEDTSKDSISFGARPRETCRQLSVCKATQLEDAAWSLVPKTFQALVNQGRPVLMEVGCEPQSLLAEAVCKEVGTSDAAVRCADWNGVDLSVTAGVRLALERLRLERPQVVWIRTPCSAFSPRQGMNQGTEEQQSALKEKRQHAQRIYVGGLCVAEAAIQQGAHVVWEWNEASQAWRLPAIQRFQKRHGLHSAVTRGCRVNCRDANSKLQKQGWKMITTHARLAQHMDMTCKCDRRYQHASGSQGEHKPNLRYTPEYINRVVQLLTQELSYQAVYQECAGQTGLPEAFGRGELCVCGELAWPGNSRTCASCLLGRSVVPHHGEQPSDPKDPNLNRGPGEDLVQGYSGSGGDSRSSGSEAGLFSEKERDQVEEWAKQLRLQGKYDFQACEEFLQALPEGAMKGRREMVVGKSSEYLTFGAFSHGGQYGVTVGCNRFPETVKYLNAFVRSKAQEHDHWSSFTINRNQKLPLHRDVHNHPQELSLICGFGTYTQGELWVEDPDVGEKERVVQNLPDGRRIEGQNLNIRHRFQRFNGKAWHGPQDWTGNRITLTAYTSRGVNHLSEAQRSTLRGQGFPLPRWKREAYATDVQSEAYPVAEDQPTSVREREKREKIRKQLYLLHSATGHGSKKHLVEALRRRGASKEVLEEAERFTCSVCAERSKVTSRHVASLEPLPPKWATVSADVGHLQHPVTKEHAQFLLILDEGSRFRTARVLTKGPKQAPNALACLQYFQEGWCQIFGHPRTLRLDPAGAFRSHLVEEYCDRRNIFLDIIPGEAHWKIGACENGIKGIKEVVAKLCACEPDISLEEALSTAIRTFNQRDMVRGFSPVQHALGRSPDETGRFLDTVHALPPEHLIENATGEFERASRLRLEAERAHAEWQAKQRLTRAANSRHKPRLDFEPGELVFFWRTQESGQSRRSPGSKRGRFLGPARVLAVETAREADGTLKPGSAVWLVRGRSLMKCCPEQLRRASPREELLESLAEDKQAPWSFTKVAEEIGGNQYQDISGEKPEPEEWHRAQDVEQEAPPRRVRLTRKRPGPAVEPEVLEEMSEGGQEPATSSRRTKAPTPSQSSALLGAHGFSEAKPWWNEVSQEAWVAQDACYWTEETAAVALEFDVPDSKRGQAQMLSNMAGFFVGAMKRRAVEVCEKRLTNEEKAQFREAKNVEVRNFIAARAFECLPEHLQPSKDQAIGMRWILTWKLKDNGERKAKARAVLLGYQDPSYEHRATTAPVMTRQTRQIQLHLTASRRWRIQKGDVSGAFLQGREYRETMYCTPSPEICEAMGIPAGSITRLKRACYGLVDAPLEWYRTVSEFLEGLGLERLWSDSCAWVWRKAGQLRGMISGHVDDFLFSGAAEDQEWQAILLAIQQRFKWSDWENDSFVQCGVQVSRVVDGFELSQPHYLDGLHEICVSSSRRKEKEAPITERERSQLRTLLGGLSWHAQQVAPHVSAEVGLLLSETSKGTVNTVLRANLLLHHTKARGEHKMKVHAFEPQLPLALYAWVDASDGSRHDGGSTQGIFVGLGPEALFQGDMGAVTAISWHSTKIDRICRSPGAAEVQAAINGEDQLYYARYQLSEILYDNLDVRNPDEAVRRIPGGLITDSRNVFDKLQTEVLVIKGAEKKSNIELLGLKEAQARTHVQVRWVHSEAQLANALTKGGTNRELELFYRMRHCWRIVEDPEMQSARKRKSKGVSPLENSGSTNNAEK